MAVYEDISELVGDTPLVKIDPEVHGLEKIELYAKLEYYNPFGSLKDRPAKNMLEPFKDELKEKNKTVLEASSGNTAKALCGLAGMEGLDFKTVTNRIKYPEVRKILQTLGAEIEELPGLSDCPDPNDPDDFTKVAENMEEKEPEKYHYTDQYFSDLNWKSHYNGTGKEISEDLGAVDYLIGTLGTCGSTYGAGKYLKEEHGTEVIGTVADAGQHVPGGRNVNELWEVGIFNKEFYTDIVPGTTEASIEAMKTLNRRCGILAGPTTGLNFQAGVEKLEELEKDIPDGETRKAVFIACDRMEWYLSFIEKYSPETFSENTDKRETVESLPEEEVDKAETVGAEELPEIIEEENPQIFDVRGHFAYTVGHVPGAVHILGEVFAQIIEEGKSFSEDETIIVTCTKGDVSKKYAKFLQNQGYRAYSLEGGIQAWKQEGYGLNTVK